MESKKTDESLSYKISYATGSLIMRIIIFILKFVWAGTVKATIRYSFVVIIYVVLLIGTYLSFYLFGDCTIMVMVTLLTILILGVTIYMEEYPAKERRKYFHNIFKEIKLQATDNGVPCYMSEKQISDFALQFTFQSLVPLTVWMTKKELLEVHMNAKIIEISQDKEDQRAITLIIETQALPTYLDWSDDYFCREKNILNIGIGHAGITGLDIEKNPHTFIAGETGSGKSNVLKCLIHQALLKEYDVILIDFKRGVSFSAFSDHVAIYYEYKQVIEILGDMVNATISRLDGFRKAKVDNINDFNKIPGNYLSRKIIFIDELAELLKIRDKEISNIINDSIETLTRLSRATGIHLIMGIQRPDSTIISGQIKNNVSFRICGRFVDKEPSRIILGSDIASSLPNIKGRFIVKDNAYHEIQSFYFGEGQSASYHKKEVLSEPIGKQVETEKAENQETKGNEFKFDFSDIEKEPSQYDETAREDNTSEKLIEPPR